MSPDSSSSTVARRQLRLSNGAELLVLRQPWAQDVGICLRVAAGSHDEPAQYPGLAHFLEHLLFLDSQDHAPGDGLMDYVLHLGGEVNASTQAHHTDFICAVPADRAQPALERLLAMLCRPLPGLAAQLREREVLQAEYQARISDPDVRINHALAQALAVGHRCSAFLAGDRSTLPVQLVAFQRALRRHHQRCFQAAAMRLVLVGPQSLEQLQALGEQALVSLPGGHRCSGAPALAMAPLRAGRLLLQHADSSVHLGVALALPEQGEALALVLDALNDPACGGLSDELRRAGLCQGLRACVLYQHAGQCLLRLDFPGGRSEQLASLRAAWLHWLREAARAPDWPQRVWQWRRISSYRQLAASALVLVREQSAAWPPLPAHELLAGVRQVLARMAASEGIVELVAGPQAQPDWPAVGLDLPLRAVACEAPATWPRNVRLPDAEPLLEGIAPVQLPAVQLQWEQAPRQDGPAALYWRAAGQPGLVSERAHLQTRCARLGVAVRLESHCAGWQLQLQGPAELLPACSVAWLARLTARSGGPGEPPRSGMPIRQLLNGAADLASDMAWHGPLQGLGVGLQAADRMRLQQVFERVTGRLDGMPWSAPAPGLHWQRMDAPGEAALLLLCPVPDASARTEAAWRLLGQWLQGRFYQRLRGELQLGYALFAGFRQVGGRRGLVFALQSPVCDVTQVFRHFGDFLAAQGASAAVLDTATLQRLQDGLRLALAEPFTRLDCAEQRWQAHLAGLPTTHAGAVRQALETLLPDDLLRACEQLYAAQGGWRVLANGPQDTF